MLTPGVVRALSPSCPPAWVRLITFAVVAGVGLVLIGRGVAVQDVMVVLGVMCGLTVVITDPGVTAVELARTLRAELSPLVGPPGKIVR